MGEKYSPSQWWVYKSIQNAKGVYVKTRFFIRGVRYTVGGTQQGAYYRGYTLKGIEGKKKKKKKGSLDMKFVQELNHLNTVIISLT